MRNFLKSGLIVALLALVPTTFACSGDSTGPKAPSVSGSWSGTANTTVGQIGLSLTLVESSSTITGNGTLSGAGLAFAVSATGTHSHPTVSLTLKSTGYEDLSFSGTMGDANTITGGINGSGFSNVPLTLRK